MKEIKFNVLPEERADSQDKFEGNNLEFDIDNRKIFDKWLCAEGTNAFNNPSIAICVDKKTGSYTCHLLCTDYQGVSGDTLSYFPEQKEKLEKDICKARKKDLEIVDFWWRDGDKIKRKIF